MEGSKLKGVKLPEDRLMNEKISCWNRDRNHQRATNN